MDTEVFDNVCAPSFAEGGLGSRLDDSTDFFERTRDDKPKKTDEVVSSTIPVDTFNVSPKKAPFANIPINSTVISETSKIEASNTKPESTFSIPSNTSNTADGSELENLGRLAMFGNRPQQKRRSQLRREERSKVESERKAPIPRPEQSSVKVPIPAPIPRDPSNARQSYSSRTQAPTRPTTSRLSHSSNMATSTRPPTTIRSRTPSVEPIRSRRSAFYDNRSAPGSSSKVIPPVAPRNNLAGPITRSRARLTNENADTKNAPQSLSNRLSQLQISNRPIAPLTSEQEFRKGIRQRHAVAPRLSSTPVGKVNSKLQDAITSANKKPPLPSVARREGSVTRDRPLSAAKQTPIIVARSPLRRTPVVPSHPRVAFGSGVRPARLARRSNTSSPGLRKYPVNPTTRPLVVTIPDTPSFMRRQSATKKDHPSIQHADTPSKPQSMQRQSSARRSRIDVAQLVDRLSKPKVLASPKRVPPVKSKLVNGLTHGLTSQRKVRSRSTSIVRPGSATNAPETNQFDNMKV
ncbi:unnamed protein product [Auanema sp. JU1783]|nr:unnamed protein product [Auanema sp. JU1783]